MRRSARAATAAAPVFAVSAPAGAEVPLLTRTFAYSSGRVIALARFVWAAVFVLVVWLEPDQDAQTFVAAYPLLYGYMAWAALAMLLVWRNWWIDFRFGLAFHIIDIVAFIASVMVTEGSSADFTSPFLAFFAYLILAAAIRWGWQAALLTGLVTTVLYGVAGAVIDQVWFEIETYRFARRITYMSLLALVMAWFALKRGEQRVARFRQPISEYLEGMPLEPALMHAIKHTFAGGGVIGWADFEEPITRIHSFGRAAAPERLGPRELDSETGFGRAVRLFDRRSSKSLEAREDGAITGRQGKLAEAFAEACGIDEALALPISGPTGRGEILLTDIDGVCRDHVQLGGALAREIRAAFDHHTAISLANEMLASRTREAIARDLHDSVVQSLAGAALRVEGLRAWVQGGGDLEPEIEAVQRALRDEQAHVRALIARLRKGEVAEGSMEATTVFHVLLRGVEAHWNVDIEFDADIEPVAVPTWMAHELDGILREAVANAVRHGGADAVHIGLTGSAAELNIAITDNGRGFAGNGEAPPPRSINGRVMRWGGSLEIVPSPQGASLRISLPLDRLQ